ncbi:MAG: zinc-ribbon domain-containing protein, partial [Anaerolineales bacterium]
MRVWKLHCPDCGTANTVSDNQIKVECGKVRCGFTCPN